MMIQNNYQRLLVPLLIQRLIIYLLTLKYLKRIKEHESDNIAHTYDNRGNITYNSQLGSYTYGAKPHAVIQAGANSYQYDANGNMTNRPNQTITYDYDNRPIAINSTTFIYDYAGQRIKKNNTVYIGKLYECTAGTCTKYIFAGSQRIASKKITGTDTFYYHTDHLGSSSVITDSAGNKVQETYYYPFGGTRLNTGNVVKHKYTGQEEDPETGLYFYNARYYDPQLGRFISADSIVGNPRDPQDLNRYTYAGNNPLIYTDPSGHFRLKNFFREISKVFSEVKYLDTIISAAVGCVVSGPFCLVGAAIAADANIFLSHTGEGRKLVKTVAKDVFDDMLGVPPKYAYMASSIALNATLNWAGWGAYNYFNGTPTATFDTKNNVIKDFENNPEYSVLKNAQGESDFWGRNISKSGSAYQILNDNGQIVGVLGKADAFSIGLPGVDHTAVVIQGDNGLFSSMGAWKRGIIEFVTGTCHQAANQALLQAGYSLTVNGAPQAGGSVM